MPMTTNTMTHAEATIKMGVLCAEHARLNEMVRTMPTSGDENFAKYCETLAARREILDAMQALAGAF